MLDPAALTYSDRVTILCNHGLHSVIAGQLESCLRHVLNDISTIAPEVSLV